MDVKERKIRVNTVSPGPIDTPAHEQSVGDKKKSEELKEYFATIVPLGEPDEVPKAVSFLASDDSSFITGIELFVDGGQAQV